jgi:hypothetical protein
MNDFVVAGSEEQHSFVKCCFKIRKTVLEMLECSKQLVVEVVWGNTHFSDLLNSNVGKLQVKIVSIEVVPPQVARRIMWGMFTKS